MKLLTSLYHAKYEPDTSVDLSIKGLEKLLTHNFDVKFQNSGTLTLRQKTWV